MSTFAGKLAIETLGAAIHAGNKMNGNEIIIFTAAM